MPVASSPSKEENSEQDERSIFLAWNVYRRERLMHEMCEVSTESESPTSTYFLEHGREMRLPVDLVATPVPEAGYLQTVFGKKLRTTLTSISIGVVRV